MQKRFWRFTFWTKFLAFSFFQNFVQNGLSVDFKRDFRLSRNVYAGCPRRDVCLGNGCLSGSTCVDLWLNYTCRCKSGFSGAYCGHQSSTFFKSSDHTSVVFDHTHPITSFSFNFSVKTASGGGILVYSGEVVSSVLKCHSLDSVQFPSERVHLIGYSSHYQPIVSRGKT